MHYFSILGFGGGGGGGSKFSPHFVQDYSTCTMYFYPGSHLIFEGVPEKGLSNSIMQQILPCFQKKHKVIWKGNLVLQSQVSWDFCHVLLPFLQVMNGATIAKKNHRFTDKLICRA